MPASSLRPCPDCRRLMDAGRRICPDCEAAARQNRTIPPPPGTGPSDPTVQMAAFGHSSRRWERVRDRVSIALGVLFFLILACQAWRLPGNPFNRPAFIGTWSAAGISTWSFATDGRCTISLLATGKPGHWRTAGDHLIEVKSDDSPNIYSFAWQTNQDEKVLVLTPPGGLSIYLTRQ